MFSNNNHIKRGYGLESGSTWEDSKRGEIRGDEGRRTEGESNLIIF